MTDKSYSTIVANCLENSTAHGIGKILKESHYVFKCLWALLFVCAVGLFSFHSSILIQRWQEMPTSVEIISSTEYFELPDVYMCPTNILANYNRARANTEEMKILRQKIITSIWKMKKKWTKEMMKQRNKFVNALWREITVGDLYDYFGAKPTDFIISGLTNTRFLLVKEFQEVPDGEYLSCAKVSLSDIPNEGPIRSLTVFFYLKSLTMPTNMSNHFTIDGINFYNLDFLHYLRGKQQIRLYLVSKNQAKSESATFITFKKGQQYFLKMSTNKFQRVDRPQSPCKDINGSIGYLKEYYNFLEPAAPIKLMPTSVCKAIQLQKYIYRQFKCYEKFIILLNNMVTGEWCSEDRRDNVNVTRVDRRCQGYGPCNTTSYGVDLNSADLPDAEKLKSLINALKNIYFKNPEKYGVSNALRSIVDDAEAANGNEMDNILNKVIKFTIDFDDDKKLLYHEKLSYTTTNLMSDIGGIFGFYMGISILTICEVFVLICHLMIRFSSKRRNVRARDSDLECDKRMMSAM